MQNHNHNIYPTTLKSLSSLTSITNILSLLITMSLLSSPIHSGAVLNNYPITFQMSGQTTYTPDAGGASRSGYNLRVGFTNNQWLGIQFITGTNKNDVLILQIDQFYTQGSTPLRTGHQISIHDYYRTGDTLNNDQNIEYDISAFNFMKNKNYCIDIIRYMGSNSGQDWNAAVNGYSLLQICFYTNQNLFNINTWLNGIKQCYFYEIDNYMSQFKGPYLKSLYLNGYKTYIYGYIDGPYVSNNIYLYHQVPLFSYTKQPAIAIEIGTTSNNMGQDFNIYSPISTQNGDYYGKSITNITKDTANNGGFQNNGLTMKNWNAVPAEQIGGLAYTVLRINYHRNISTYDGYDRKLQSTFIFCLYLYTTGTINSDLTDKNCEVVELSYHYPRMVMPEKIWEQWMMGWRMWMVAGVAIMLGMYGIQI